MCYLVRLPLYLLAVCSACRAFITTDLHTLYRTALEDYGRSLEPQLPEEREPELASERQLEEMPFRVIGGIELAHMPARHQDISTQWLGRVRERRRERGHGHGRGRGRGREWKSPSALLLPPRIRSALRRLRDEARKQGGPEAAEVEEDIAHMGLAADGQREKKSFGIAQEGSGERPVEEEVEDDYDDEDAVEEVGAGDDSDDDAEPFWHHPCGKSVDLMVRRTESVLGGRQLAEALQRVWQQLNMTVLHYKLQRFDKLYYKVRIGVDEHQYVPNWVPGREDLLGVRPEQVRSNEELAQQLTRMHTQLQKFSIAVEQIAQDQRDDPVRHNALFKTQNYVKMLLCEVEWALLSLAIPLPQHIPRDIMSPSERQLSDTTDREVRDWGVLLRYRDFLNGWADFVSRTTPVRKRNSKSLREK